MAQKTSAQDLFIPDKMRREFEGIWPRSARNEGRGTGDGSRVVTLRNWQSARLGRPDNPVGRVGEGDTPVAPESGGKSAPATASSSSPNYYLLATTYLSALGDAFNTLFGVPEAKAWEGMVAGTALRFYHTDHLGSTRVVTDEWGWVHEYIDYLPFGEIFRDDETYGGGGDYGRQRFKYTGQMYDYLTGLYYYGARYYDPEIGRFTQADTVVPKPENGQAFNRYSYVNNNPYKYVDPSGHFFLEILTAIVIAAVLYAATDLVYSAITGQHFASWEGLGQSVGMAIAITALDSICPGISLIVGCISLFSSAVQAVQGDPGALASVIVSLAMIGMSYYGSGHSSNSSEPGYQETGGTKADFEGEKAKLQQNKQAPRERPFQERTKPSGSESTTSPSSNPKAPAPKLRASTGQAPSIGAARPSGYGSLGYGLLAATEAVYDLGNDIINTYMYAYGLPKQGQKEFFALVRDSAKDPSLCGQKYFILVKGERTYSGLIPESNIGLFFSANIQNYPNQPINPNGYSMRDYDYFLPAAGSSDWRLLYIQAGGAP